MSDQKTTLTWDTVISDIAALAKKITENPRKVDAIIAIGRGGGIPGNILGYALNVKDVFNYGLRSYNDLNTQQTITTVQPLTREIILSLSGKRVLVVDDLSDNGETLQFVRDSLDTFNSQIEYCTLYVKQGTTFVPDYFIRTFDKHYWIVFPWDDVTNAAYA